MGADVSWRRLQARTTAKETKEQPWRTWDDATEESNRRDETRAGACTSRDVAYMAGVTNPFAVEADTTAEEPTECRSTEEGLTMNAVQRLIRGRP